MEEQKTAMTSWLTLASFSFHAFVNSFMWLNFACATEISEMAFHVDDAGVNWFYSAALLSSVPSFICAMTFGKTYHWATSLAGIAATVIAAWLRYMAIVQRSYALVIMSSVALGPGAGMIFTDFAQLPALLFPQGPNRKVSTGIAVQITFFGWAVGGLVAAVFVKSTYDLTSFSFIQALVVSLCLPVFFYGYRLPAHSLLGAEGPQSQETYGTVAGTQMDGDVVTRTPSLNIQESASSLFHNWRFLVQALACALLQAVGFTVPAVLEEVFSRKGYGSIECAWAGFAFIMAGVVLGMVLAAPTSGIEDKSAAQRLVLALFWTATLAMLMMQLSVGALSSHFENLGPSHEHGIEYVLIVVGGACSLGFLNVTIPLVCAQAHPVPEAYSGGITELLAFGLAAALTQLSAGLQFSLCFGTSLAAALLMSVGIWFGPVQQKPTQQSITSVLVPVPVPVPVFVPVPVPVPAPVLGLASAPAPPQEGRLSMESA